MLVSAIMPTGDRAAYAPLALQCFLRQTWKNKDLVVIDDGAESMAALFIGLPLVRYVRSAVRRTVGEKRNLAVNFARGSVVIHWDDDDWSAADRMERQLEQLMWSEKRVVGYHRILYWDEARRAAYRYQYQGPGPYACGTSQCYWRTWALAHPFPAKSWGEDTDFSHAAAAAGQLASEDAGKTMVVRSHNDATGRPPLGNHRSFPAVPMSEIPEEFFADLAALAC